MSSHRRPLVVTISRRRFTATAPTIAHKRRGNTRQRDVVAPEEGKRLPLTPRWSRQGRRTRREGCLRQREDRPILYVDGQHCACNRLRESLPEHFPANLLRGVSLRLKIRDFWYEINPSAELSPPTAGGPSTTRQQQTVSQSRVSCAEVPDERSCLLVAATRVASGAPLYLWSSCGSAVWILSGALLEAFGGVPDHKDVRQERQKLVVLQAQDPCGLLGGQSHAPHDSFARRVILKL